MINCTIAQRKLSTIFTWFKKWNVASRWKNSPGLILKYIELFYELRKYANKYFKPKFYILIQCWSTVKFLNIFNIVVRSFSESFSRAFYIRNAFQCFSLRFNLNFIYLMMSRQLERIITRSECLYLDHFPRCRIRVEIRSWNQVMCRSCSKSQ